MPHWLKFPQIEAGESGYVSPKNMRRAAKVDDNHPAIVNALRRAGCNILSLAALGKGCPDLLVHRAGKLVLLEIKDGSKVPSKQRLTKHQCKFRQQWPVSVVKSEEEAITTIEKALA